MSTVKFCKIDSFFFFHANHIKNKSNQIERFHLVTFLIEIELKHADMRETFNAKTHQKYSDIPIQYSRWFGLSGIILIDFYFYKNPPQLFNHNSRFNQPHFFLSFFFFLYIILFACLKYKKKELHQKQTAPPSQYNWIRIKE